MPGPLDVEVDDRSLRRAVAAYPTRTFRELRDEFRRILREFETEFKQRRLTGRPGLARRTGALVRSFEVVVTGTDVDDLRGTLGTDSKYAAIHEYGGRITPTRGQYLAIPLAAALTRAGVTRDEPRSYSDAFFITSRSGTLLLVRRAGGGIEPLFAMKRSVTIPARMGLTDLWQARTPHFIRRINVRLAEVLRGL